MNPSLCIAVHLSFYYTETRRKIKHNRKTGGIIWGERVIDMNGIIVYPAGNTAALRFACRELEDRGIPVVESPAPDVTHLLLPVPSFEPDGRIKGGGIPEHILADLPETVTVVGGKLAHPALEGLGTMDLLRDPLYTAENAALTADCAIRLAGQKLSVTFDGCPILVIGWGRIGKCLTARLKAMGADVTVAARKEADRAMLRALGCGALMPDRLAQFLCRYRVIFNTVPAPVLSPEQLGACPPECLKIDLASLPGLTGSGVIRAGGLPNRMVPESSGRLIAGSFLRLTFGKEASV